MAKQSFEYARVLNMPDIVHSLRSLYLTFLETEASSEPFYTAKMGLCGRINIHKLISFILDV